MFKYYILISFFLVMSTAALSQSYAIATAIKGAKDPKAIKGESLFMEAVKSYWQEDFQKAIQQFKEVNKQYEESSGAFMMIAKSYLALTEIPKALDNSAKALALDKKNVELGLLNADLLSQAKDYANAEKAYKQILKTKPDLYEAYAGLVNLYLEQAQYTKAINTYDALEKNIGPTEEITRQKQTLYLKLDNLDKAISEGEKLISAEPEDTEYISQQAKLMLANGKIKDAQKMLEEYLAKKPNYAEGHIILAEIYQNQGKTEASHRALNQAFANKNLDIASKIAVFESYLALVKDKNEVPIEELITLNQELIKADPEEPKPYIFMGDILMLQDNTKEARDAYFKSTSYDKSLFDIWITIVELDKDLKDWSSLILHAQEAADYFPNQPFFWYHAALGQLQKKNFDEAIYAFEEAELLTFDNPDLSKDIATRKGEAHSGKKDYVESIASYEAALKIDPAYPEALNKYSYLLASQKIELNKAEKMAQKLVKAHPNKANYAETYAKVLFQKQDYPMALKTLEKWTQNEEASPSALDLYGDILAQLGKTNEALSYWEKAKAQGVTGSISQKISQKKYIE